MDPVTFDIAGKKLREYLLNVEHPDGASKAKFFLSRGFDPADIEPLARALLAHASDSKRSPQRISAGKYGTKIVFVGPLKCPDGRTTSLKTVWLQAHGSDRAKFVTAYPDRISD